ncbi:hypothetical protein [Streptomyces echinatus]|uniref:hypothetical protein n=1 Tax=Streptomyces echinatus TaxID=67293 RepID=UPI0037B5912D
MPGTPLADVPLPLVCALPGRVAPPPGRTVTAPAGEDVAVREGIAADAPHP